MLQGDLVCRVGCVPVSQLVRPVECTGCLHSFIAADLHSFLECQTTSAFPAAAGVIGSQPQANACGDTGAVPPPAPRQDTPWGRGLHETASDLGSVMGLTCQTSCVSEPTAAPRARLSPNPLVRMGKWWLGPF